MSNQSIYERDFVVWAEKQAHLLEQHRRARRDAARETGLDTLPEKNPYALEQVLDENFLP